MIRFLKVTPEKAEFSVCMEEDFEDLVCNFVGANYGFRKIQDNKEDSLYVIEDNLLDGKKNEMLLEAYGKSFNGNIILIRRYSNGDFRSL